MNFLTQFSSQISSVFGKLNPRQKFVVFGVFAASLTIIVIMMMWAGERPYVVLFSNLAPKDAQLIRARLDEDGIPYKLETDGTAILVPQGEETGFRLEMAAEGIPSGGTGVGYEIFDRPNLGLTDFIQKVNYRRALESELSRTIQSMAQIQHARVHIVLVEPTLFIEDKKETTASVILTLQSGTELLREQVQSITKLVAFSIEGLQPRNVSIVDSYGSNLSEDINREPLFVMTANQLEIRREVEAGYRRQIETLLTRILGPDRSMVRVSADLDFSQTITRGEQYDPSSAVVISEERNEGSGAVYDTMSSASREEGTISNYVVNKINTETKHQFGQIKRLTIAVTIDTMFTEEQAVQLEGNIQAAVGYSNNQERTDVITVTRFPFDTSVKIEEERRLAWENREAMVARILRYSLLAGAAIIFLIILRSIFKSLDMLLPKPKPKPAIDIEAEAIEEEISAEAQRRSQMLEQVARFAKEKPENVASLMSTWLLEEGG